MDSKTISDFDKVEVSKLALLSGLTSAMMYVEMERLRYAAAQRQPGEGDVKKIMDTAVDFIVKQVERSGVKVTEGTAVQ